MEIVSVADLKIGMFVVEPDCPWTEFPFALQGFVISTPDQIDLFQAKCRFVRIDRSRSNSGQYMAPDPIERDPMLKSAPLAGANLAGAPEDLAFRRTLPLTQEQLRHRERRGRLLEFLHYQKDSEEAQTLAHELHYIEPRFDDLHLALQRTVLNVSLEKQIDLDSVREGVRDMAGSLRRTPDALMWLLRLKRVDEYSFDHAMEVSIYLLLLATHIGWRGSRLLELGIAGLLQDIGKVELPVELLTKTTPLNEEERTLIQSHVASSLEILYGQSNLSPEIMVIISRHHERWDGSGYPRGLKLEQIGIAAEMAGLVDSFCAMLKNKPYRSALGHQEALEELHLQRDKKFNPALMEQFVQCVGLYPIGTFVELSSGEVGVVILQNRVQRSRPRVLLMLDARKMPIRGYQVLDLRDEARKQVRIVRALPHDAYGLAEHDYYLG